MIISSHNQQWTCPGTWPNLSWNPFQSYMNVKRINSIRSISAWLSSGHKDWPKGKTDGKEIPQTWNDKNIAKALIEICHRHFSPHIFCVLCCSRFFFCQWLWPLCVPSTLKIYIADVIHYSLKSYHREWISFCACGMEGHKLCMHAHMASRWANTWNPYKCRRQCRKVKSVEIYLMWMNTMSIGEGCTTRLTTLQIPLFIHLGIKCYQKQHLK